MTAQRLALISTSRAEDAGYLAMADLSQLATHLEAEYRLVGGHMVSLLVAASGVTGVPGRDTGDADFGVPFAVAQDPRLLPALTQMGYTQAKSNRFQRDHAGRTLTIDVLAPSYTGRLESNQPHGDLHLDEIPGLGFALTLPGVTLNLEIQLTEGTMIVTEVVVPSHLPALCLKAIAFAHRSEPKDAMDVWRLLEVAVAHGMTAGTWPTSVTPTDAASMLRRDFGAAGGHGLAALPPAVRTRVRALVHQTCGAG